MIPRPLLPLLFAASAISCADVPRALAPETASARRTSDTVLSALAARFGPVAADARFAALRPRLARAGLVPSRVYDDDDVWSDAAGPTRELLLWGEPAGDLYRLRVEARPPAPARPGEYRGRLELERLRKGEFEWRMREELALGPLTVEGVAGASRAVLALAGRTDEADAREALRASLPRTSAALGRVLSLDRLALGPRQETGRLVEAEASLHPEWLGERMPRYAAFLKQYVGSLRMSVEVSDTVGAPFWSAGLRDGRLFLRLRVRDGALVPLEGPPRRLEDACRARVELTMKSGLFRVGFEELAGDVALQRDPHAIGFRASFPREPDWKLPFFVEPFMRGSLRRPFEGTGALLEYDLRDDAGAAASATVSRFYRLAVKESWIVRWLGGNVGGAVSDFRRGAEAEADRFSRDAFLALRDDVRELIAPPG